MSKYQVTIGFEVDTDNYTDVQSREEVLELVDDMFDNVADFPEVGEREIKAVDLDLPAAVTAAGEAKRYDVIDHMGSLYEDMTVAFFPTYIQCVDKDGRNLHFCGQFVVKERFADGQ